MTAPTIKVGDKVPTDIVVKTLGPDNSMVDVRTGELFAAGKKTLLFAVPGAFTPTCSLKHLPGFVEKAALIREKHGFNLIACIAVNDAFVMSAWGQQQGCDKAGIMMLADGNGDFHRAIGLLKDATGAGMGWRSHRYAMVVEDGTVRYLGVDEQRGVLDNSGADRFLGEFMPSSL